MYRRLEDLQGDGAGEGDMERRGDHTSAASAAFLRASLASSLLGEDPPRVRGGPPTFLGTLEVRFWFAADGGAAEERVRPGWAKGSVGLEELLQQLPMVGLGGRGRERGKMRESMLEVEGVQDTGRVR
jgi:hypothetical protein